MALIDYDNLFCTFLFRMTRFGYNSAQLVNASRRRSYPEIVPEVRTTVSIVRNGSSFIIRIITGWAVTAKHFLRHFPHLLPNFFFFSQHIWLWGINNKQ
jgi:hypothetical protein